MDLYFAFFHSNSKSSFSQFKDLAKFNSLPFSSLCSLRLQTVEQQKTGVSGDQ